MYGSAEETPARDRPPYTDLRRSDSPCGSTKPECGLITGGGKDPYREDGSGCALSEGG